MSAEPERFDPGTPSEPSVELALARLPVGRHGLPRSFVAHNQRMRIVAAMLQTLPRRGYAATTIGHLTKEAGVSRAAFYEHFASKEACFLATYDLAGEWLYERVERAAEGAGEWPFRIRAGASELLGLLAANPALAHLVAVEPLRAGPAACSRQQACLRRFAEVLRAGRPARTQLPVDLEEVLLGGAVSLVARYVDGGRVERLPDLSAELTQCLLIPYLGQRDAARVIAQAA